MSTIIPTLRSWMDENTCKTIIALYEKLPAYIVEHSLDILERYELESRAPQHYEADEVYLNRVTTMLIEFADGRRVYMTTGKSTDYDLIHELNIYLDGWLFAIDIDDGINIETDRCYMHSLPTI